MTNDQAIKKVLSKLKGMHFRAEYYVNEGGMGDCWNDPKSDCYISGDSIRYYLCTKLLPPYVFNGLPMRGFEVESELQLQCIDYAFPDGLNAYIERVLPDEFSSSSIPSKLSAGFYTFHYNIVSGGAVVSSLLPVSLYLRKKDIKSVVDAVNKPNRRAPIWDELNRKIERQEDLKDTMLNDSCYAIIAKSPYFENYLTQREEMIRCIFNGKLPIEKIDQCEKEFFQAQSYDDWDKASFADWLETIK